MFYFGNLHFIKHQTKRIKAISLDKSNKYREQIEEPNPRKQKGKHKKRENKTPTSKQKTAGSKKLRVNPQHVQILFIVGCRTHLPPRAKTSSNLVHYLIGDPSRRTYACLSKYSSIALAPYTIQSGR